MDAFLFLTDLDNTLVGDAEALATLNQRLAEHRDRYGTKIVYVTGRSLTLYRQLEAEQNLLEPDGLVVAVGTEIYGSGSQTPDPEWAQQLSAGWERDRILATTAHFADLVPQPSSEQGPFKLSYFLSPEAATEVLPLLGDRLRDQGIDARLVYSSHQDLDILPKGGNKGTAMAFLQARYQMPQTRTVACGDSGNDIGFFEMGLARGIIVGNARAELLEWHRQNPDENRYLAQAACAGGILEGLNHFGFLPKFP
ncbi:sucrose-phosphate phosphatase [Geitlerinema sp. PCC 7407]|uniref:sucrose-phosphate phosphatase n=1 Tax=Geitlerinema sp. PCC 7407 TaxID=1173025 RepID=UPI00029FA1F1|nr:sucrose-phosphate phosphatase [Geitlerinema sp. PCC 7407]AFY66101.1 sucrose phosphatase [Geitlerinema sp. PCC 7407]